MKTQVKTSIVVTEYTISAHKNESLWENTSQMATYLASKGSIRWPLIFTCKRLLKVSETETLRCTNTLRGSGV